ncbi:wu:fc21g02 isoform X1 [Osmerus eperlanus]|uniref:wu:fc21g02 isoform X1 n=1 Tax=Osmerus eperlanus TaxID=29151 RepID=UPI002E1175FC
MMWCVWILLGSALSVDTYTVHDIHERLSHGRQLKIYLPKSVDKLEFTPANEPGKTFEYWNSRSMSRLLQKGYVSGTGSDRRWYLNQVTFDDEGTYTQKDFWNKEISTLKVAVTTRHDYIKRVAGQSLYISLEGIHLEGATLSFSGEGANVTLVQDGSPVSRDLPNYYDRVKTHSTKIEITNVNTSDVGYYKLKDRRDREVSVNRMELVDHLDDTDGNPLMALLLLLGIPAGICCCCRKKIFKRKPATTTFQAQGSPENVPLPPAYGTPTGGVSVGPGGPVYYHNTGPAQDPNIGYPGMGPTVHPPPNPGMPGPQWNGPPPAMNPVYPIQDPMYPPAQPPQWNGPPPAQPPQWNGPPPAQPPQWNGPPPGPGAPMYYPGAHMGYAPVMYSSPPPMAEPAKVSPTDPLLAHPPPVQNVPGSSLQPPVPPPTAPVTADNAYQFQIEKGNSSSNFL